MTTGLALLLMLAGPTWAQAQPEPAAAKQEAGEHRPGGEVNLVLPNLEQVDVGGYNGRNLLLGGVVVSIGGLLFAAGFSVFRLNFRDHGGTFELNHGLFHSCRIADVVGALTAVTRAHTAPRTFLVGHSLGGNFALRAAARAPRAGLAVDRVVAVCPVLRPASTMNTRSDCVNRPGSSSGCAGRTSSAGVEG